MNQIRIEESWKNALSDQFEQPYFQAIVSFIKKEKTEEKIVYPPGSLIFNAFDMTPFDKVKVVILGQDPYHNKGEAMGLSFSVPKGVRTPPSLLNIYKALNTDLGLTIPKHGDLSAWANQGVFLLNAMLTVGHTAGSHKQIGWQFFTDAVIRKLSQERENIVFMLWGNFAKQKKELIDTEKHLVLEFVHPSPLAGNSFATCRHFSMANNYLKGHGQEAIDWQIV